MTNEKYMKLLFVIDEYFEKGKIIITWANGLIVKCRSFTGIMETDIEPDEEDFVGEYTIAVNEVEILQKGNEDSVEIFNNAIEISLKCIPKTVSSEDGTVIWQYDTVLNHTELYEYKHGKMLVHLKFCFESIPNKPTPAAMLR